MGMEFCILTLNSQTQRARHYEGVQLQIFTKGDFDSAYTRVRDWRQLE